MTFFDGLNDFWLPIFFGFLKELGYSEFLDRIFGSYLEYVMNVFCIDRDGKELPDLAGIYMLENRRTLHRMVGQASNLKRRVAEHLRQLKARTHVNCRLKAHVEEFGSDAFLVKVLEVVPEKTEVALKTHLGRRELWWALTMRTLDERYGYNLVAGGVWSPAARFRNRERKLMRHNSGKYLMLPGVDHQAAIHPELLASWIRGNDRRDDLVVPDDSLCGGATQ